MANLLNFKFGLQPSLASQALEAGTVYVTTDEHALYLDLPKAPDSAELQRIRIGDIIVVESARTVKPPFAEGAFYYFVAENALLRWDGTAWKQLNADTDLTSVETSIQNEVNRSTAKDTEHDAAIKALQEALANYVTITSFTEFKTANTKAIEEAKKAGTDAQATANTAVANAATAQGTADNALAIANKAILKDGSVAMTANLNMSTKKIINLGTPESDTDAATKAYVDSAESRAKADASTAKTRADEAYNLANTAKSNAATAQSTADSAVTKADNAQNRADAAYELAETKATLADVDKAGYALTTEAQAMADAVLGSTSDNINSATVHGAIKKADAAAQAAANAQAVADSKVSMADVEKKGYATVTQLNNKASELLGSTANSAEDLTIHGAHKAADEALARAETGVSNAATAQAAAEAAQSTADTAKSDAAKAQSAADTADAKAVTADEKAQAAQADISAWKTAHANDYTNTQIDNKVSAVEGLANAAQNSADAANDAAAAAQTQADKGVADAAAALTEAQAKLDLNGGTMKGSINMGGNAITNVADLTNDSNGSHAANKNYVDSKVEAVSSAVSTLSTTLDGVKTTADGALQKSGGTMSGELKMGGNKISNVATPTVGTDAANMAYVDKAIADGIKANDAMTFKGTVGGSGATVSSLPSTAQKGDTYKVAQAGKYNNVDAKIGDLFINSAADDTTATWVHVSSGYEAEYVQTLIADTTTVYLTDGVNDTVGQAVNGIKFVGSANSNLQFAVSTDGNIHTVTASMVWGTF